MCAWSDQVQVVASESLFQMITFNHAPIGPSGFAWVSTGQTNFICPVTGWYNLSYKVDVLLQSSTNASVLFTRNGAAIDGSVSLVQSAASAKYQYSLANTVLVQLIVGDILSAWIWSNDTETQVGDTTLLGTLPGGVVPTEATATVVFTRIQ